MLDLNDLYYFAHVVEHGGFSAAGRALGLPRSKLSRRVAQLEERLGVQLLHRTTRRFAVTEIGRRFHAHCRAMLLEAEAASEVIEATRPEPRGVVRFSCPVALVQACVGAMVADFLVQCPRVTVHLRALNRPVDLIAEGFDFAVRVRETPLPDSDLVLKVLGWRSQCLVASPALLQRLGAPATPADLARFPSLDLGRDTSEHLWSLHGPDGAHCRVPHAPRLVTDDMSALRDAALAGAGIVHLPAMLVSAELERGRLLRVLPGWAPPPQLVHAVLPTRRHVLPSVRALLDHLAARFAALEDG